MRHQTERLVQSVFLLVGFPLSDLLSPRWPPGISSTKFDCIPRLRARRLAAGALIGPRAFATERSRLTRNGDIGGPISNANEEGRSSCPLVSRDAQSDLPVPERPAIVEHLLRQRQEEQMLCETLVGLTPQYRRLMEVLFLETLPCPCAELAADSRLAAGSIGCTQQRCLQHLCGRLAELGFR